MSREAAPGGTSQAENVPEEDGPADFDREVTPKEFANYEKPIPGKKENLNDFLLKQLRINTDDEIELKAGTYIINQLDDNGYLREDLTSVAATVGCNEEEAQAALKLIQSFEPPGVAARDIKECLLLQLKRRGEKDGLIVKVIEEHLEDLASRRNLAKLCKKLKCDEEELNRALEKIHSLEPKPGRSFSDEETAYVIPDITIEEKDNELAISTKDDTLPVIRVNPLYRSMLKSAKVDDATKEFIRQRIVQANSLIHALQSRKDTLVKVVTLIAQTQKEAILEGNDKLKPLTLKEIAEKVTMHESTISRVVMHKYVQTPSGIWRLRDFFSSSLKTTEGEDISSQSIKVRIQELIDAEDKTCPLRDKKIAELINESEKTPIARRTVAKYREALKIPPASQRRK